jgi:hypothetical protein
MGILRMCNTCAVMKRKMRRNLQKKVYFVQVTNISENFTKYGVSCTKHFLSCNFFSLQKLTHYPSVKISMLWPHIYRGLQCTNLSLSPVGLQCTMSLHSPNSFALFRKNQITKRSYHMLGNVACGKLLWS